MKWIVTFVRGLFFASIIIGGCAGTSSAQKRFALVIGNKDYSPNVGGQLTNPIRDVELIGNALTQIGFEVASIKDAKRVDINREVGRLGAKLGDAGDNTIGLLYYSGHGVARAQDHTNYLIPVDVKDMSNEDFWFDAVPLDAIIKELVISAPKASLFVVFDACRSELRLPTKSTAKGFEAMEKRGVFIAFSTSPSDVASDIGDTGGPYARALAAELLTPGQDQLTLFQNVKERVFAGTLNRQTPWESNGFVSRVYVNGKAGPGNDIKVASPNQDVWFAAISSYPSKDRNGPERDAKRAANTFATGKPEANVEIYRVGDRHVVTIGGATSKDRALTMVEEAKARGLGPTAWASDRVRAGTKVAQCDKQGCDWRDTDFADVFGLQR